MPLIEPEAAHSNRVALLAGIPSLIAAVIVSLIIHQYVHTIVRKHACEGRSDMQVTSISFQHSSIDTTDCPLSSLAAVSATLILALGSFGIFIHSPRNLFFAAMAFINATARLPEAITLLSQFVVNKQSKLISDESSALTLLHFKDPTAYTVILLFYVVSLFFFAVTIIHDARALRGKWLIALALLLLMWPLQQILSKLIADIIS